MNFLLLSCLTSFGCVHLLYKARACIRRACRRTKVTRGSGQGAFGWIAFLTHMAARFIFLSDNFLTEWCYNTAVLLYVMPLSVLSCLFLLKINNWPLSSVEKKAPTKTNLNVFLFFPSTFIAVFIFLTNLLKKTSVKKIFKTKVKKVVCCWLKMRQIIILHTVKYK